jgi:hypothetical protein
MQEISVTLKMEATCFSYMSADFYLTTRLIFQNIEFISTATIVLVLDMIMLLNQMTLLGGRIGIGAIPLTGRGGLQD